MFMMVYFARLAAFALLVPLAMSKVLFKPNITNTMRLSPPATPSPGRQVVDAAYQSFSIEFSYMADYGGNDTYAPVNSVEKLAYHLLRNPNLFSKQVVQNLYDVSGAYPIFRVGGSTQNSAVYYPNQTEAIIDPFVSVASDQPSKSMLGPAWMQSFQQFPKGTNYIYGRPTMNCA
jgi:hypothetical protein